MSGIQFAAGEAEVSSARFSPSVILFWLKTEIGVSNTRIVTKSANTLLGVIPLGFSDAAYPLKNTASVGVDVKFSLARAFWGLVFLIMGFSMIKNAGVIFLIFAVSLLANVMTARLNIQNNGGSVSTVRVSVLEKAKLIALRDQINERLFADHAGLRHAESINLQTMGLMNQHQSIQQQQLLNQHLMGQNAPQQPVAGQPNPGQGNVPQPPPAAPYGQ